MRVFLKQPATGVIESGTIPDAPVLVSVTDNQDEDSITVSVTGSGTIQLYYRQRGVTSWTAGLTKIGDGDIVQTGLTAGRWYEIYITAKDGDLESIPSAVMSVYVIQADDSGDETEIEDSYSIFLDLYGETVSYYSAANGQWKSIKAVVNRDPSGPMETPPGGKHGPKVTVTIANDADDGVLVTAFDSGRDKIKLAIRKGDDVQERGVGGIISQDAGMFEVWVR